MYTSPLLLERAARKRPPLSTKLAQGRPRLGRAAAGTHPAVPEELAVAAVAVLALLLVGGGGGAGAVLRAAVLRLRSHPVVLLRVVARPFCSGALRSQGRCKTMQGPSAAASYPAEARAKGCGPAHRAHAGGTA